jgi:hypothetical protein
MAINGFCLAYPNATRLRAEEARSGKMGERVGPELNAIKWLDRVH